MLNIEVYYDETAPFTSIKWNHTEIPPQSKLRKYQNMDFQDWAKDLFPILYKESNEEEMQIYFHGSAIYFDVMEREAEKFTGASRIKVYLQHLGEQQKNLSARHKIGELLGGFESELSKHSFLYTAQLREKLGQIYHQYHQNQYMDCCNQIAVLSGDLVISLTRSLADCENHRLTYRQVSQEYENNQLFYREWCAFAELLKTYEWLADEQALYQKGVEKTTRVFEELKAGWIPYEQRERIIKKMEVCQYDLFSDFAMHCDIHLKQEAEALRERHEKISSYSKELQMIKLPSVFDVKAVGDFAWSDEKEMMTSLAHAEKQFIDRIEAAVREIRCWKDQALQIWFNSCRQDIEEMKKRLRVQKETLDGLKREIEQAEECRSAESMLREFQQQWVELGRSL